MQSMSSDGRIKRSYYLALLIIAIVVLVLIVSSLAKSQACSFSSIAGSQNYSISTIEMMKADEAPITYKTAEASKAYKDLSDALKNVECTFKKDEVGMSLEDTLYTLFLSDASSEMANYSFSSDGMMHDNEAEKTYELSDKSIYELCKKLYEEVAEDASSAK